ncbi:AAA domain-containing protein, partial [Staphylococcus aureus]
MLAKDHQAKILITSQTNLAVDNVLQRMAKVKGISFIRLGRNIEDTEINKHSFENKLTLWARNARGASEKKFLELKKRVEGSEKKHSPIL